MLRTFQLLVESVIEGVTVGVLAAVIVSLPLIIYIVVQFL